MKKQEKKTEPQSESMAESVKSAIDEQLEKVPIIQKNRTWLNDFCNFKVMILPLITKWVWGFITVIAMIACIGMMFSAIRDGNFLGMLGSVLLFIVMPIVTHILFEFYILFFSILDILREIRELLARK